MPRRAASHTTSLINRTWESGGSLGGNFKEGVVHLSRYPNISMGYLSTRTNTGKCCIDTNSTTNNTSDNSTTNNTADNSTTDPTDPTDTTDTTDTSNIPTEIPILPIAGYGPGSTWSTTISHSSGGTTTYYSSGVISFQGDTLPH
jgi:hypothetical protein